MMISWLQRTSQLAKNLSVVTPVQKMNMLKRQHDLFQILLTPCFGTNPFDPVCGPF